MRRAYSSFTWILRSLVFLISFIYAQPADISAQNPQHSEREDVNITVFNGKNVPPMTELNGPTYKDQISTGLWLVKAFSPYCVHCMHLAPKWQTLYEFYYTSKPPTVGNSQKTFSSYYGLNFAALDCVAFGDACREIDVTAYPTMIFFKDGGQVKKLSSDRDMEQLGRFIEEILEYIEPGSRPKGDIELPTVGEHEFYPQSAMYKDSKTPASGPVNPNGTSLSFDYDTFQTLQKNTLEPWFVKFFDPSCPHCQAMAASWRSMAEEMKGKLNVGEVDCSIQKKLCTEAGIRAYPTIKFLRGPEEVDYQGLRGLGDFIDYANQAAQVGNGVTRVNAVEFEEMEKTEEVIFVYFYDHATTSEDMLALERLPMMLMGKARLVKSDDKALAKRFNVYTWPRLLVARDGRLNVFDKVAPHEIRNVTKVQRWMKSVWLPLVPELTSANAHQLMDDKLVVLAILSRAHQQQFAVAKREMKNAVTEWMVRRDEEADLKRRKLRDAKQLRIKEAQNLGDEKAIHEAKSIHIDMNKLKKQEVVFAWVDGVFWERWIRTTFGISVAGNGERVIINDQAARLYWDLTSTGNPLVPSKTAILETLSLVTKNPSSVPARIRGYKIAYWSMHIREQSGLHPWLATWTCTAFVVLVVVTSLKIRRRRRWAFGSNGFSRLEEKIGVGNGSFTNGKVD